MKQTLVSSTILLLCFTIISCSDPVSGFSDAEKNMYRAAAYNFLSDEEKESIISDWHDAPVNSGIFAQNEHGGPGIILEGSTDIIPYMTPMSSLMPEGTHLVTVTFNTSYDALLGPVIIILSEDGVVVGTFLRM